MPIYLLQNVNTKEIRTARHAINLSNEKDIVVHNVDINELDNYSTQLKFESALPIGSVEFVRKAMKLARIEEPMINPYVTGFMHRSVDMIKIKNLPKGRWFIKPVQVKLFNGFIFDHLKFINQYDDPENVEDFISLPDDTDIWISEVVTFVSEFRYYIDANPYCEKILGCWRYDSNDEENVPIPDMSVVERCMKFIGKSHPYVLDFGVLEDGTTALVEYNDFWAIGLYGSALKPTEYLDLLEYRWECLFKRDWAKGIK